MKGITSQNCSGFAYWSTEINRITSLLIFDILRIHFQCESDFPVGWWNENSGWPVPFSFPGFTFAIVSSGTHFASLYITFRFRLIFMMKVEAVFPSECWYTSAREHSVTGQSLVIVSAKLSILLLEFAFWIFTVVGTLHFMCSLFYSVSVSKF
jgi:hypothetical protein